MPTTVVIDWSKHSRNVLIRGQHLHLVVRSLDAVITLRSLLREQCGVILVHQSNVKDFLITAERIQLRTLLAILAQDSDWRGPALIR